VRLRASLPDTASLKPGDLVGKRDGPDLIMGDAEAQAGDPDAPRDVWPGLQTGQRLAEQEELRMALQMATLRCPPGSSRGPRSRSFSNRSVLAAAVKRFDGADPTARIHRARLTQVLQTMMIPPDSPSVSLRRSRRLETGNLNLLKLAIFGVWMGVTTMAAIYASATLSSGTSNLPEPAQSRASEDFKTEHIAVAVFLSGKVRGYFTARIECRVFDIADKEKLKWILSNDLHRAVYANNQIKYEHVSEKDIQTVTTALEDILRQRKDDFQITELKLAETQFLPRI
jgi:hypothetical protein